MTGRAPRFRFRFRLRALLIAFTMVAVALAWLRIYLVPWWSDHRHSLALKLVGGQVFTEPRGHFLLRQFGGEPMTRRSVYVHLSDPRVNDDTLAIAGSLPYVEVLSIRSPNVTDAGLVHLERLSRLLSLNLVGTQVTPEGVARLRKALPRLMLVEVR
jgi:hypothetical protein